MKVALYARVSTDDDEDRLDENGEKIARQDPEVQLDYLKEYCKVRNFTVAKEYSERKSGADDDRAVLKDMINDAKRRKFEAIVVFKIDRLTRSPLKLLQLLAELPKDPKDRDKYLVHLISATEGVDTSSYLNEGYMTMLSVFAKMERENLRVRVKAGLQRARKHGTKTGRPIGRPRCKVTEQQLHGTIEETSTLLVILPDGPRYRDVPRTDLASRLGISRRTLDRLLEKNAQNPRVAQYINNTRRKGDAQNH